MANPTSIGKYEILATVGRGGMGVVYRAQDPRMGRQVAIKTVTEGLSNDAGMLQRFYREAEKMGMLKHPNIITVYDLGEQDGFPYIVMEFVEGDPLDRLIQSNQPLPLIYKLRIIEQVCSALGYAHHHDVVHRDVKPANVIVRPDGVAKLLDFGIARQESNNVDNAMTAPGGVIGTVPYMAPERLKGATFDGRSDIFAVGVLLYQVLTGHLPFPGEELALVSQLLNEKHPPLSDHIQDYPPALDVILERALEKEPEDRYQTAEEMAADLYLVTETLKKDYSEQLMAEATKLSESSNFVGARDALVQLLKLDNQHTQARKLLAEVNQHLTRRARSDQAHEKRVLAEDALRDRNYEQAIRLLEEATKLVPDDAGMARELESAREKKQTSDQILGYLRQADVAKRSGDYVGAQAIVEKAIKLDTNNSRLRSAYNALVRQAAEAAQQAKVKALLDAAKDSLRQRNFLAVMNLVEQAEQIDPSHPELQSLTSAANEGLFQEDRRRLLDEIEGHLSAMVTYDDVRRVAQMVRGALEKSLADATLLRYQAQIDRRLREYEAKQLIDETVKHCRATMDRAPLEALEAVKRALVQLPGDERLTTLEEAIQDRIAQRTAAETRNAILLQAKDALKQRKYSEAVTILDQCQGSLRTNEISELLEFAREEARRDQRQQVIGRVYAEAQALLRDERYEEALILLGPALQSGEDARLRGMFDQAQSALEQRRAEHAAALELVTPFAKGEYHEQVIALIQGLPSRPAASAEIQTMRNASQEAWMQEWALLEKLGQAYAALASGEVNSVPEVKEARNSTALHAMNRAFANRRLAAVDQILSSQIQGVRAAKAAGTPIPTPEAFAANKDLLPFASESVRVEWSVLTDPYIGEKRSAKLLGRLGKRS
jgi:eukaryotic-like serine/threonine-protein kinase